MRPIIDITHEVLPDELNEQLLAMELECLRAIELLRESIKRGVSPESEALINEVIEIL